MQLTCPCCSCRFSLEASLSDAAARRMVEWALKMPAPLGDLIIRYIAMFRPPLRALTWSRVSRLLGDLQVDIARAAIERHGRLWTVTQDQWRAGFEEILNQSGKLKLPLKSHGYLHEILVGIAEKAEAGAERKTEVSRRRRRDTGDRKPRSIAEITSELNHVLGMVKDAPNAHLKSELQKQVDGLERELNSLNGPQA